MTNDLFQDLRYGVRTLLKTPGFTVIAVLTLALGIGANTMIFSVVNAVLLRPLPFPESGRLVRIGESHGNATSQTTNFTYASFVDLGEQTESLERIAASRFWSDILTEGAEPEQVFSMQVSANFFPALGVSPALGRVFLPEEDQRGRDNVVIISHRLWERRYGGDPSLIGKTIKVSGIDRTVLAVMPPEFQPGFLFTGQYDLWTPLVATGFLRDNRRSHLLAVIARLKPGATVARAESELAAVAARIEQQNPGVDPDLRIDAIGLQERLVAPMRTLLMVLLCAVGCVLLIACANVANLMLARSAGREREMAIRSALGVDRDQPISNISTMESVLAGSVAPRRFNMLLLSIFAAVALALAAVGIYGVISYTVSQRTQEIGIRLALGARSSDVLRLVVGQGMRLTVVGVAFGLAAAFAVTRLMSSLLYGVSATDRSTFAAIALLLSGVALLACYLPARRATKVDPMIALRCE
jgi:ABC-type antimicrobial peptide transport system permease subunit